MTSPSPSTPEAQDELVDALLDGGLRMLITTIVDNAGITRAKTVPAARLRTAVRDGIGLSPVFALMCTDDAIASSPAVNGPVGDMRLIPDLAAAAPLGVRGDVVWAPADQFDQEHRPMDICQRSALRRQEQRAVEAGLTVLLGLELEFTMFTGDPDDPRVAHIGPPYGVIPTLQLEDFARDLFDAFEAAGLMVEQLHPEYGRGQVEVALPPASPVAAVDQALLARMIIHRLAHRHGLLASFSPVTVAGAVGNGAHIHFSAATADAHFGDSEGQYGLSKHAQHLIAGVLAELDGLTGVLAPSVVSADRRVPGNWAGAFTCWGPENREAALRLVPGSITSRPASTNCEIKIGDPSANLYLAATAVLASALTGLEEKLPLPAPAERDPVMYTEDERTRLGIRRLPTTLEAALEALENSPVLRAALGEPILSTFLAVRRHDAGSLGGLSLEDRVRALRWRY
ncbi:glutamine synthetase [Kribbella sp. VKM Ac-2527]|uniref:Glutamine synthetase n=1 Tax=Kribbella caucasensis TaxID=2512215 RepID=A0A4R6K9L2_9ACTN|nr:glutamine synthetase family protein [Kribbella sp. VKM Ac-2527]TDO46373.1 glutamine synthetase [Kribbella sp. VKM Ac-2527]